MNAPKKNYWSSLVGVELNVVSPKEKLISMLGGLISVAILIWLTHDLLELPDAFCIVLSMGASAVLLFAMPQGPLSQPWPVIAGHTLSALMGVIVYRWLGQSWWSGGVAVALSIGVMHQLKCVHPPGGATALTAVMGSEAIHRLGYEYVLSPVLMNAVVMVLLGVVINWAFPWRRYPSLLARHKGMNKPHPEGKISDQEDVVKALKSLDSFVDLSEDDILMLARLIAREREARLIKAKRQQERESKLQPSEPLVP